MSSSRFDKADSSAPRPVPEQVDLLVVGGGINGAGIARDAAGRGLSVLLCERDDLAGHTSSASSKLIHGGLRYLEYYEFGLVRKALQEREVLLRSAPHIMWPLRFVLPHDPSMRPAWMMRAGLFLYDHLARRELLPGSQRIDLSSHPAGAALKESFHAGFVYSDGWVDDARLVILNAIDAARQGATVLTRTACGALERDGTGWRATLRSGDGSAQTIRARAVVNATGQWAARFHTDFLARRDPGPAATGTSSAGPRRRTLRLVKGSHIVVPRLFEHAFAYILQNPDGRIVFAIPYEDEFTLIGTTDVEQSDPDAPVQCSDAEVNYLCDLVNRYFRRSVGPGDVLWRYAGVRPLLDDESGNASAVTRDYKLEFDNEAAPHLTVWGGKITTYRKLAEEAVDLLGAALGAKRGAWTASSTMPGGDEQPAVVAARLAARFPWLPESIRRRWVRSYGTGSFDIVARSEREASAHSSESGPEPGPALISELGPELAPGLHEAELEYLRTREWARSGEDVLWRRTKIGVHLDERARAEAIRALDQWFARRSEACAR